MIQFFFNHTPSEEKLKKSLAGLSLATPVPHFQDSLRLRLMQSLQRSERSESEMIELPSIYRRFLQNLKAIFGDTAVNDVLRISLLERLIVLIERKRMTVWFPRFSQAKGVWSMLVLVLFVITVVAGFTLNIDTVRAAPQTYLDSISGNVFVLRGGKVLKPHARFLLKAKDNIRTLSNATASIYFLDDSIARLAENTEVTLQRLFVNPRSTTETLVEVGLEKGKMWSKVVNLVDDASYFQVTANDTVAVAHNKATFETVADEGGKTQVSTYQNSVDIAVKSPQTLHKTTVVKGYAVKIENQKPIVAKQKPIQKDEWVASNLEEDKAYVETLARTKSQERRALISTLPIKEISISAKQTFGFNPEVKVEAMLKAAALKLVRAEIALDENNIEEVDRLLHDYKTLIEEVNQMSEIAKEEDAEKYALLRQKIDEHVAYYKKQFALLLPGQDIYQLKSTVQEAERDLAEDAVTRSEIILDQASDKLLEAEALGDKGEVGLATEQVEAYSDAVESVVDSVKELPAAEQEDVVSTLIDQRTADDKTLKVLQEELDGALPLQQVLETVAPETETKEGLIADPLAGVTVIKIEASDNL